MRKPVNYTPGDLATYDPVCNTVHVSEAHFGPRLGFDGEVLASQLNKLANCISQGIHVKVEVQFRVVLRDVIDVVDTSEFNPYLGDHTGRVPAIEEALAAHPDIDAFFMTVETIQALMRLNAMVNLQYRGPNGLVCRILACDECGPNEIWFVSWKLEEGKP